ncbi:MAG: FAD-dependent oxidoreductase [Myxococcales bacterium]|nr:FAD-dependent oxidoreductase [Myxococcota bacterium]MDW8281690.1 FAD-dependent oxidoreductase [Myxococcales bacterium]
METAPSPPVPPAASPDTLVLGIEGFRYADLYSPHALRRLYERWLDELRAADAEVYASYLAYRDGRALGPVERSELLCAVAPHVSRFVLRLFGPQTQRRAEELRQLTEQELRIFRFKDEFVRRRALKRTLPEERFAEARAAGEALLASVGVTNTQDEKEVAEAVLRLLDREAELKKGSATDPALLSLRRDLDVLCDWVIARRKDLEGRWISFVFPRPLDYQHLVHIVRSDPNLPEAFTGPPERRRERDGFKLTDRRMSVREVLGQVDYCMYCHDRDKDSCSKGLRDKTGALKQNPLGITLAGCPLGEKISEMHLMKRRGDPVAALALVCLDNPLCPGTGHRICNDCMKACIYQKQEPVNIPQIETAVLTDVLSLPWGVEIYGLLTRWNPLNVARPYPLPYCGRNVLVVGLGPAGYTLTHYLAREGFGVIGVDGLKLEPLPPDLVGDLRRGVPPRPVYDYRQIEGELDQRVLSGFGGVSEYGITVRWDKNFLTLLYLTLSRNPLVRLYGGVRFGGTLTLEDAWEMGIDHVAIAAGAGKPTLVNIENNLCRGMRKASDFLMALQLTGAYKHDTLANLQIRLPALVIGGGLTAIDTATELLAYYVVQVERTLARWQDLLNADPADPQREARLLEAFDEEERQILQEQLEHGRQIRREREQATAEGRPPRFSHLLNQWGGVSLVYRKNLVDSPAYRLNHEEVEKSLEEGVRYIERLAPRAALNDAYGALRAMVFERQVCEDGVWRGTGEMVELPARTVCVAAGTSPNTIYEKEHPGTFQLTPQGFFAPHRAERLPDGNIVLHPDPSGFFTSYCRAGHVVSYYGDNHPRYAGSVVKAMASAKHGYRRVAALFPEELRAAEAEALRDEPSEEQRRRDRAFVGLCMRLDDELLATVVRVERLTPTIVDIVVRAPLQARKFRPGQFYRLQNLERYSPTVAGVHLVMEGLALTGAWTDPERGLLSLIVLEMGASSRLCAALRPGEPVIVMGPTGMPTEIPRGETVCLVGGGLGNAVLFSIAKALHEAGCRVLYFAGYKRPEDIFKQEEIEAATDQVIWSTDVAPGPGSHFRARRPQDRVFVGNIVQALVAYGRRELGGELFDLGQVDRMIVIGSDRMMAAVKQARHTVLRPYLNPRHMGIGSINSPMQCMMKEVCAQCLQRHIDPVTGKETIVFSCFNQDQELDRVDFENLAARLRQNTAMEKLTALWLDHLLRKEPIALV